jgi:hypothetical protein
MFLFLILPALILVGMVLIVGPALLPFVLVAGVTLLVWRTVARHHHPGPTVHPH